MKLEIEISDRMLKEHIDRYIANNLTKGYYPHTLSKLIEKLVKEALIKSFNNTDFSEIIKDQCHNVAIKEIEKAAKKKVPGWVNRQMKEMLKYSRARFWENIEDQEND